jgi:hypothetical protein
MAALSSFLTRVPLMGQAMSIWSGLRAALGMGSLANRFILNIGDEGATLVQIRGGQVVDAIFAEAAVDEGWDALREMLRADPKATVLLVADVLEQMFREDTVPKVGLLDRRAIVKRRLDLTYPNDLLKAALPYPRKRGEPQSIMFTALPMSAHLERWVAFLNEIRNPILGFFLLPLEVVDLAERLAPPTQGETRKVWHALISQEAASGFRQVFSSGGRMVVTRLTQRPTQALTPDTEAMLIERELRSSISYIKRLGFGDADRLDVVLLADPAVCRAVGERDLPATSLTAYTPYQAGVLLGLGEVGREDTPFADVMLGLWVAAKRRRSVMLPTPRIREQLKISTILQWSMAATVALTLLTIVYAGSLLADFASNGAQVMSIQNNLNTVGATLAAEIGQVKGSAVPLEELTQVAENEERLAGQQIDLIALLGRVGVALGSDGRVIRFAFEELKAVPEPQRRPGAAAGAQAPSALPYEIHIEVKLAGTGTSGADPRLAVERARTIGSRLADAFPKHEIKIERLPVAALDNQVLEGSVATAGGQDQAHQVLTAEYIIRKAG